MFQSFLHSQASSSSSSHLLHSTTAAPFSAPRFMNSTTASPSPSPSRRRINASPGNRNPNLRKLTSRIVDLTKRRQLDQILKEVEVAKRRFGRLNTIVMNAVMEACVHCGDVDEALQVLEKMSRADGCGVDSVTYGIVLKGLGRARRIDDAFQMLESVEQGNTAGNPKLSPRVIHGLLNALLEAGDRRRASGLIARYRTVLQKEGHSVLLYNLLMKGYIKTDYPLGAIIVHDEILRQGLKPDRLTYNTLAFAYVKSGRMDEAVQLLGKMKEEAQIANCRKLFPDAVTYTTLLKGFRSKEDLPSVQRIVIDMKSLVDSCIDRIAYTAVIDSFLACGSVKDALCIFGEMIKLGGGSTSLKPKPHVYLSLMRAFATRGDFMMVKNLHSRMWFDSVGSISLSAKEEADDLLMEAAFNDSQIDVARQILSNSIMERKGFSWASRGGLVAVRLEAMSGIANSKFSPYILPQVLLNDPIEKYMIAFDEANPIPLSLKLENIAVRFLKDAAVPVIDEWGSCVGIVHRDDCRELDAPLSTIMRGPPPCVTTSTSVGRVIELLLEKKYKMIVVVRSSGVYETSYSSNSRPVGIFTQEKLFQLAISAPIFQELSS